MKGVWYQSFVRGLDNVMCFLKAFIVTFDFSFIGEKRVFERVYR